MSYSQHCAVLEIQISPVYIYIYLSCCKNESIVIAISGNWEYETGLSHTSQYDVLIITDV